MRFALVVLLLTGCAVEHSSLGGGSLGDAALDAPSETGLPDLALPDAGADAARDMAPVDAPLPDMARPDAATDMAPPDMARPDMGPPDMSPPDMAPPDMRVDVDPCTVGPDADGDGVVDACDECPGFDDRLDSDSDGIADGCDDWPCGTRPTYDARVMREGIAVSAVDIQGMGNTAVLRVGERFSVAFDWNIDEDPRCTGCVMQVEWGFSRVARLGCAYSGNPPAAGASGRNVTTNVPVFSGASGVYELRFNRGYRDECGPIGTDWWPDPPVADRSVGAVCVVP